VVSGATRFRTHTDWLDSAHCFSFGEHYDPTNVGFGRLMVSNHEHLVAGRGFDDHPHVDAEIVTWVLSGALRHADSTGQRGIVHRGLAQRMSAGRGVVHQEMNDAAQHDRRFPVAPVEYVQMWVRPDEPGAEPSYAQAGFDPAELDRGWVAVASGTTDALVGIGAQATLWVTRLAPGIRRNLPETGVPSSLHCYVAVGAARLEGWGHPVDLATGDAVRIAGAHDLAVAGGSETAELLVWQS